MRLSGKQRSLLFLLFAALLAVTAIAVMREFTHPWQWYQKKFKEEELAAVQGRLKSLESGKQGTQNAEKLKALDKELERLAGSLENIKAREEKIAQIWLVDLNEVDRCTTCHQGVEKPDFQDKQQPFKTHPGDYLKNHPLDKFGCVTCHAGQGSALTVQDAHGEVEHWLKPLMKGSLAQASCGRCHPLDRRLPVDAAFTGAEEFVKGRKLYLENNCLGCHKLSGHERPKRIAPSLTPVGKKADPSWITAWIKKPKDYLPKTKMPDFSLKDDETAQIAAYLLSLSAGEKISEPKARERLNTAGAVESGKALVSTLGCLSCHTIDKKGGTFGPDLSGIGGKTSPDWLFSWLKDPKQHQPGTPMPDLRIPEEELQDLVAYLHTLKKRKAGKGLLPSTAASGIDKGRKLVKDKGCTGCHEIEKFPLGFNAPEHDGIGGKRTDELVWGNAGDGAKTLAQWLQIKVKEPKTFATEKIVAKMPKFGFSDAEARALTTFLMSLRGEALPQKYVKRLIDHESISLRGGKLFEDKNCLGCHKLNQKGGEIAPELTYEGKKVRPDWLYAFLKAPARIRPMQEARMPDFQLSDYEANTIVEYFSYLSKEPYPYVLTRKKLTSLEDIDAGKLLYHKELACLGCHPFEGKGGMVGPEHTDMASRLKREWVEQWLKDPQASRKDVIMPSFKFRDRDREALTDYLMTMGKERFLTVE